MSNDDETLPIGEYFDRTIGLHAKADGGFPYPYGSDLHWLWGWGERIDTWLLDGKPPNQHLPGIFCSDRLADAAITRLCDRFPQAFGLITVDLRDVEKCFEALDDSEGKQAELDEAMMKLRDRIWITARLVADAESAPAEDAEPKAYAMSDRSEGQVNESEPTHSPDFTSVNWFGTRYTFTKGNQAESVRVLWEAWEKGRHSLSQETTREKIYSAAEKQFRLSHVFRRRLPNGGYGQHPAWGTMIKQAEKGCYHLQPSENNRKN